MDPDLPRRFYEDNMPDFNQAPVRQKHPTRPPVRELLGDNIGRRITVTQRGAGSLTASFHNYPQLPNRPSFYSIEDVLASEHGYALR